MNILLIGGAGYIGSNVAQQIKLNRPNDYVLILDDFSTSKKETLIKGVDWVECSTLELEKMEKVFAYRQFDLVMDFSAKTIVSESVSKPLCYYDDNFVGTLNILKCVKKYNVKYFIFSSTAAVYGNPKEVSIKEDSLKDPINPYGSSKYCSEMLIKDAAFAYDFNYVIFRYFNVAGASDNADFGFYRKDPTLLIPALNEALINNKDFHIFGNDYDTKDGTCIRDYIHVVDLAKAHIKAIEWLENNNQNGDFNLGSGSGFSVQEVVDEAQKVLDIKLEYDVCLKRAGDPAILITNNQKAKDILGFEPTKTLADMIKSDYDFRVKHRREINQ